MSTSLLSKFEYLVYPWALHHAHPNAGVMMSDLAGWRRYTTLLKEEHDRQMRGEKEEEDRHSERRGHLPNHQRGGVGWVGMCKNGR